MERRPVIAITSEDITDAFGDVYFMAKELGDAVRAAGGVPIGACSFDCIGDYAKTADALLIVGAQNVHPFRYGQIVSDFGEVMGTSASKDDFDFAIFDAFYKAEKPIFGINRGAMVINAAMGGTLRRSIPNKLYADGSFQDSNAAEYSEVTEDYSIYTHGYGYQNAEILPDSRLAKYIGTEAVINTFHNQACDAMAEGLKVTARAEDGIVEAFEHERLPIAGVQWNPEHLCEGYDPDGKVIQMFVDMAREALRTPETLEKPLICINGGGGYDPKFEREGWATNKTYAGGVVAAGGVPVLLYDDACADEMAQLCDGLILTGSFSYSPRMELRERNSSIAGRKRTQLDKELYWAFKKAGKPIFGICLGLQIINLFEGGVGKNHFAHREGVEHIISSHTVQTIPGSFIEKVWGTDFYVNSRHANAIKEMAPGFKVTGTSPDGIIEATEHETLPIYAFQFHPERMRGDRPDPLNGPDSTPLFAAFIEKCIEYRK